MSRIVPRMRRSRVLEKLRNGQVATCVKLNLGDARVTELAAMAGFDCIWTDMEHVPNDWSTIEKQVMASKIYDTDIVVRVARGSYSDLIRPLEMDATGIMIPHVMNLADAQTIVKKTKFHPLGLRALDGGNADGAYCQIDLQEYLRDANEQRFNILQIEDPEPLESLDEILSLPGLDMIFFGPGDFSQAIGAPGNLQDERVIAARIQIAEAARKHGKFAGTVGTLANFDELVELGYRFINVGADVVGLGAYFNEVAAQVEGKSVAHKSGSLYAE